MGISELQGFLNMGRWSIGIKKIHEDSQFITYKFCDRILAEIYYDNPKKTLFSTGERGKEIYGTFIISKYMPQNYFLGSDTDPFFLEERNRIWSRISHGKVLAEYKQTGKFPELTGIMS